MERPSMTSVSSAGCACSSCAHASRSTRCSFATRTNRAILRLHTRVVRMALTGSGSRASLWCAVREEREKEGGMERGREGG
eukprot:3821810-Rhodomonas_salina.2